MFYGQYLNPDNPEHSKKKICLQLLLEHETKSMGKQARAESNQIRVTVAIEMSRFSMQHVSEKYFVLPQGFQKY